MKQVPIDHQGFTANSKTYEDDTPGRLKYGGYWWRDVHHSKRIFSAKDSNKGTAFVEIVDHAPEYKYVVHDFFGTYRRVRIGAGTPPTEISTVDGIVDEGDWMWQFLEWANDGNSAISTICVSFVPMEGGVFGGTVGWYHRGADGIKTILFGFSGLDGVPRQLIDKYLNKYPSSVRMSDFHGETWVADDVHKWLHLTQLHKSDRMMFEASLGRLAAYDRDIFGARDAFMAAVAGMRAEDMAAVDQAIETIRVKAEQWLVDRDKKKTSRGAD
ncbi:hypothetical protein JYU10_00465 [bacterium AH-315-J04]|nr:hypothetical protein [bacterium AH-315-J04]